LIILVIRGLIKAAVVQIDAVPFAGCLLDTADKWKARAEEILEKPLPSSDDPALSVKVK
jgi:hypothetical protein